MKVFVSCPLPGDAIERLSRACNVVVGDATLGVRDRAFLDHADTFDVIVVRITDAVDVALLDRATRLRLVANVVVGVDHVDLAACRARGVVVTNTPGVLTEATADLAFALLLAACRRVAEGDAMIRAGEFPRWGLTSMLGVPVFGASLGIVGLGRIGAGMARRARGFGMHAFYTQRGKLEDPVERALGVTYLASADELFRTCDIVTLHCPLTDETRHIASRARLSSMKPGSVFINTSRGACVDEEALADVLAHGPIAFAGLDVFEHEPQVSPRLVALRNVVLTPHIASADRRTREAMASLAVDNVLAFANHQPLITPVP